MDKDEPYIYFEGQVLSAPDACPEIKALADRLQQMILFDHHLLRVRVCESKLQGPEGTVSVRIELVDKLKYKGNDQKETVRRTSQALKTTKVKPRIATIKADNAPLLFVTWSVKKSGDQLLSRLPGSKTGLRPTGVFAPLEDALRAKLTSFPRESNERLKRAAQLFAGVSTATIEEAEHAIDRETERRIIAERVRQIKPIDPQFWSIPKKYLIKFFKYAMNTKRSVYPYDYLGAHGGFGFSYSQAQARQPLALRSVEGPAWPNLEKHTLRGATAEALYGHTTFVFTLPERAHRFINAIPTDCLFVLKKIELHLETDVSLAYWQQFLGFTYDRDTFFMRNALAGHGAAELFEAFANGCQELKRLNLVVPSVWRMGYSGAGGTCRFMLCKWLAKAMGNCAALLPEDRPEGHSTKLQEERRYSRHEGR